MGTMRWTSRRCRSAATTFAAVAVTVTVCVLTSPTVLRAAEPAAAATCRAAAMRRFRGQPVVPSRRDGVPAPRTIHEVWPKYPPLPAGTRPLGHAWLAYLLIAPDGAVADVWVERALRFEPAFPAFMAAGVHAVREWRFAPTIIGGRSPVLSEPCQRRRVEGLMAGLPRAFLTGDPGDSRTTCASRMPPVTGTFQRPHAHSHPAPVEPRSPEHRAIVVRWCGSTSCAVPTARSTWARPPTSDRALRDTTMVPLPDGRRRGVP